MLHQIAAALLALGIGYVTDRYSYARKISKGVAELAPAAVPMLPAAARAAAELAVIEANQAEINREVKRADAARRKHEIRMAAIQAGRGDINVGNLKD